MNSIATSSHLPALMEPHEREAPGRELDATLHDLVSLSLIGKRLHWAVVGREFRSLHLQIGELVDSWRELSDVVAERAVALGELPEGRRRLSPRALISSRWRRRRSRTTRSCGSWLTGWPR